MGLSFQDPILRSKANVIHMGTQLILGLNVCLLLVLVVIFPRRQQFGASEMLLVVCSKHFSKLYLSCYNPVVLCFVLSLCLFCCVLIGVVNKVVEFWAEC